jgi:diguanylate cyclase
MLEMLEAVTGLESTYLTRIDSKQGLQHILYSRNVQQLQIPEGLVVSWDDTLCKRALDEGRVYTDNVAECWGDSAAARELGIQTYVSTPVRTESGGLYGTLCAASADSKPVPPSTFNLLGLFARLIGHQVEREQLVRQLSEANAELAAHAATDALTGLPNRRAFLHELRRMMAQGERDGRSVLVAFVDLDDFKTINDLHGHETGDEFLVTMARRLQGSLRAGNLLARLGGDEFVAVGLGPAIGEHDSPVTAAQALGQRLAAATAGEIRLERVTLDYEGASVGAVAVDPRSATAEEALGQADAAMYAVKRGRRAELGGTPPR